MNVVFQMYFYSMPKLYEKYYKKFQTLNYYFLDINLDSNNGLENQEKVEQCLSGIILDQSVDDYLKTKDVTLTNASFELESLINHIPNQMNIADVHDIVFQVSQKITTCHTKGILKPIYEPKLSSKVKYSLCIKPSFVIIKYIIFKLIIYYIYS